MSRIKNFPVILATLICLGLLSTPLAAQPTATAEAAVPANVTEAENVVTYPASFFARYRPDSALDMLKQLPGFIMAVSGELRGYGSDAGNVLIDGRRPSSKRVTVPSILDRIPASQVERIELIRGPIRDIELLGEPEVANVVLKTDVPAAVRWSAVAYRNFDVDLMPWFSNVSLSDRWKDIDYNAGLDIFRVVYSEINDERIVDGAGNLIETRAEQGYEKEFEANFDLTASTWIGETLLTWNSQIGIQDGGEEYLSSRAPLLPGETDNSEVIDGISDELQVEAGITAERRLTPDLRGNLLLYVSREKENEETYQRRLDASGAQTDEIFRDTDQIEKEAILRTEFEWSAITDHTIRLNLEGTFNRVANMMVQTEEDGSGPVTVFVPGANTTIKEYRGDFLLKDTWSFGNFELDYGMGFEISNLSQAGDADTERSLTYLKPSAELSYTPTDITKLRLRLAREVAQLVFQEFISASLFQDEDVVIANPELRPETTWVSELGYERRFGAENVLKLTLFYHRISDVQDLIPIALTEEAPGNIGDGRRLGLKLESTLQMDWLGLRNGRLDVNAVFQDSSVTDPVTGEKRVLTAGIIPDSNSTRSIFENDNELVAVIDFRQDFEELDMAWGWEMTIEGDLPVHKVDEFDIRDKEPRLNFFAETTRWFGIKMRLEFNNALDNTEARERTFYTGQRGLSPVLRRQIQNRTDGREFGLSVSGSF